MLVAKPKRGHLGDLGVDVRTITMDLKETGWEGADWIHLALDRVQGQAVVNTVMDSFVP
jgi:hypothetical protein